MQKVSFEENNPIKEYSHHFWIQILAGKGGAVLGFLDTVIISEYYNWTPGKRIHGSKHLYQNDRITYTITELSLQVSVLHITGSAASKIQMTPASIDNSLNKKHYSISGYP